MDKHIEELEELFAKIEKNKETIEKKNQKAKEEGKLVGRYIKEPYADGFAVYEVIRENKKTARIRVVTGIGDDWVLPMFGEEATVNKSYVLNNINRREAMSRLMNDYK